MRIVGIDPGINGAIASLETSSGKPDVIELHDMPVIEISSGREEINSHALFNLLDRTIDLLVIEEVQGNPTWGSKNFAFGKSYGQALAVIALAQIPVLRVKPQTWKKQMLVGTDKSKQASVSKVNWLYPTLCLETDDHDKAEALLLALYGRSLKQ